MANKKVLTLWDNSLHIPQGRLSAGESTDGRKIRYFEYVVNGIDLFNKLAGNLNSLVHNKDFVEKNLFLFGDNYEYNTDDNLLNVLGWNNDNYIIETGNLVGYISTKKINLNITSRFGDDFLKYLLCYTEGLLEIPDSGAIGKDGLFDWIIIFLWKRALQKAYCLGILKQYIPQHKKLYTIKGNVDVLDYSINKGKDGKTLCHYYQYDYNNPVTQLIAYTFSKIEKKKLIEDCIQLKNTFENCVEGKRTSLSACLNTSTISNPYYSEYNKVINLSKNILRKRFGDITDSSNIESAFLFDMSMLFEYFIRKVLMAGGLDLFPKNYDSMKISRGLGKGDDRHLYPDIIIDTKTIDKNEKKVIEVYDVKYKRFSRNYGVKREDLYQLHTYVAYLSNFYTIKSCGFIYPQDQEEGRCNDTENVIKIHEIDIPFFIRFFNIPENKDKSENIEDRYKKSVDDFVNRFKK